MALTRKGGHSPQYHEGPVQEGPHTPGDGRGPGMATKKKAKKKATKRKAPKRKATKKKATKRKAPKRKATKKKATKRKAKKVSITDLRKRSAKLQRDHEQVAERIAREQGIKAGGVSLNEELANRGLRKEKSKDLAARYDICDGTRRVLRNVHAGDVWEWLAQPKINKKYPSAGTEAQRNAMRRRSGVTAKTGGAALARERAIRKSFRI